MKFSEKVGNGPMNKRLNFGGDPDHRLDTEIVFWIRHYGKWLTDIHSYRFARWRDRYRDTGKTCLGGGMHRPTASSSLFFLQMQTPK